MNQPDPPGLPRGAVPPGGGVDPPGTVCHFAKRTLDKMSWLAPLVNNPIGDRLNLELRHEHLFFICGDRVVDNIGYSDQGTRFSEADFGKSITTLEEMRAAGYWFVGRTWPVEVMREALRRQQDGYYYNFLSNQCQDWADRLKRNAERVERERGVERDEAERDRGEHAVLERFTRPVPPTEPASVMMGLISLAIGLAAIAAPLFAANAFGVFLGLVFVASGLSHIAYALHGRDWRNLIGMSLIGLLYVAGGVLYLFNRNSAIVASSTVIALVLGIQGLVRIGLALRGRPLHRWLAALVAGVVMLVGAVMAGLRWPSDGDAFFGLIVGLCLLVGGLGTVWLSWSTRHEEDDPGTAGSTIQP